jgi:putative membrane protein
MMMGFGMGFSPFGLLFMLLFWGVLIALAIWLVRALFPAADEPAPSKEPTADEILNQRYARGEISRDDYHAMRDALRDRAR